jgi:cyclophilin family peptidyl-prolyl cis-trans isomerase
MIASLALVCCALVQSVARAETEQTLVWLNTDEGAIIVALDRECCPRAVDNFLAYVDDGFYDGLVFHRVVPGFVIQGGGFDRNLNERRSSRDRIVGEPGRPGGNQPYTIAMGLVGNDPDSGQNQFYINVDDNAFLNERYTVFGEVVLGRHVVDRINGLRTISQDVPLGLPVIRSAHRSSGFPIMPLHSGSWFDPARSGVGFNVEIANEAVEESGPFLLIYWYDFNAGQPIWLSGVDRFDYGASAVTLDLIHVPGPNPVADFQRPPERDAFEIWGQLTVRFIDCHQAEFSYVREDGQAGDIELVRLTLPDDSSCRP